VSGSLAFLTLLKLQSVCLGHAQFLHTVGICYLRESPQAQGCVGNGCWVERELRGDCHPPIAKARVNNEGINDGAAAAGSFVDRIKPREVAGFPIDRVLADDLWERDIPCIALLL